MSKKLYGLLLPVLAVGLMASAASASAAEWKPYKTGVTFASGNVKFEIKNSGGTTTTLECESTTGFGKTGEESSAISFKPTFTECTAPATAPNSWTARAIGVEEASIEIPNSGAEITVSASPSCKIIVNSSTIADTSEAKNFHTSVAEWRIAGEVNVADSPATCFSSATKAKVSAIIWVVGAKDQLIEPI